MEPHHMNGSLGKPATVAQPGSAWQPSLCLRSWLSQLGLVHSPSLCWAVRKITGEGYCQDRKFSAQKQCGVGVEGVEAPRQKMG